MSSTNSIVPSEKIRFEIGAWLTCNYLFELVSFHDLYKALDYVNKKIYKREVNI